MLNIFLSNQLEVLYHHLKRELFSNQEAPFSRRLVVVYGPAMKTYLMHKMAQDEDMTVSLGIEWVYFNDFFENILSQIASHQQLPGPHFPTSFELSLLIEKEIESVICSQALLSAEEKKDWEPVLSYFKSAKESQLFSKKSEKRLTDLSQLVAKLFLEYGRFAPKMVNEWESKPFSSWQHRLWAKIFCIATNWSYPSKEFLAEKTINNSASLLRSLGNDTSIHFFSISFLTSSEFSFIENMSLSFPIHYYLISPCAVFWSDIKSDKEATKWQLKQRMRLKGKEEQMADLEEFLKNRNPLLANFGRMGREMAYCIEESLGFVSPNYMLPEKALDILGDDALLDDILFYKTTKPLSLLQYLQTDLLVMRSPDLMEPIHLNHDRSITLHMALNHRREVEILYQNLLQIMNEDASISPDEIIVMAPQMALYLPYIKSVFGADDSLLNYQVLDLGIEMESDIIRGYLLLIELSESKWEAALLMQLFSCSSFQKKHQITPSEKIIFQRWMEESTIRWGHDFIHRRDILNRRHCETPLEDQKSFGTWDFGFSRLMMGLATTEDFQESLIEVDIPPCASIDFTQGDLFGKWMRIIHSLKEALFPLEENQRYSLIEWSSILTALFETNFACDEESECELESGNHLKRQLEKIGHSLPFASEYRYPFSTIKTHLLILLRQRSVSHRESHQMSVCFCSLVPLRTIPAKVIAIIGLQEGNFPRHDHHSSLNMIVSSGFVGYSPTLVDYDRYLFLEAIHAAREKLILSYCAFGAGENKEQMPSLVIQELFSYLDKSYRIEGEKVSLQCSFKHPLDSFDPKYFMGNQGFFNASQSDFRLARNFIESDKSALYQFMKEFPYSTTESTSLSVIDLRDLNSVVRNPFKFHLKKALHIAFSESLEESCDIEDEVTLSALDKFHMKQLCLKHSVNSVFYRAEREGKLPFGLFKEVAKRRFEEEMEEVFENLKWHHLSPSSFFTVEFSMGSLHIEQIRDNHWLFPPIVVHGEGCEKYHLVGKITECSSSGLFSFGRGSLAEVWKVWPKFLFFCAAAKLTNYGWKEQLIFSDASAPKSAFFDDVNTPLLHLCRYYNVCLNTFSPLLPSLLSPIIEGSVIDMEKEIKNLFHNYLGHPINLDMKRIFYKKHPSAEAIVHNWSAYAKELLHEIVSHWFSKKRSVSS